MPSGTARKELYDVVKICLGVRSGLSWHCQKTSGTARNYMILSKCAFRAVGNSEMLPKNATRDSQKLSEVKGKPGGSPEPGDRLRFVFVSSSFSFRVCGRVGRDL